MSREQARQALQAGAELVERERAAGLDVLGTGEMGIGNTTAAAATAAALTGQDPALLVGRGTGLDDAGLALAARAHAVPRRLGTLMVRGMAPLLRALSVAGTAAMLWVGGGILLHGLELLGEAGPAHAVEAAAHAVGAAVPAAAGFVGWVVSSLIAALLGLAVGLAVVAAQALVLRPILGQLRRS